MNGAQNLVICHKYKFIYCPIPKNACSSILKWILMLEEDEQIGDPSLRGREGLSSRGDNPDPSLRRREGLSGQAEHDYIHTNKTLKRISMSKFLKNINTKYKDYYSFVVLRNPHDRVLSAFKDKFIRSTITLGKWHRTPWQRVALYTNLRPNSSDDITFREFIDFIDPNEKKFLNGEPHWRSQLLLAGIFSEKNIYADWIYDKVILMENLDTDFKEIFDTLNIPKEFCRIPYTNSILSHEFTYLDKTFLGDVTNFQIVEMEEAGKLSPSFEFYDEKMRKIVSEKYSKDIDYISNHRKRLESLLKKKKKINKKEFVLLTYPTLW